MDQRIDLDEAWPEIRRIAHRTMPAVLATTNEDGAPQVTPIGSLSLHRTEARGTYLERFPTRLRRNLDRDPRCAVLLLDRSPGTWLRALWQGRFPHPPGVRLIGRAGPRRPATDQERERFLRRVRPFRGTRGHGLLWEGMADARDLFFDDYAPIALGAMTAANWRSRPGQPSIASSQRAKGGRASIPSSP